MKKFLYYIPLLVAASCNVWFGAKMNFLLCETLFYIVSMVCVGFLEEIIFRGFLFKAMAKDNINTAVVVSSLTFGIGHIVNLFNGSGVNILSNLCQVIYAVAFGFLFVIIFLKSGSLIPCIAVHSIINALSVFAAQPESVWANIGVSVMLTVIAVLYGLYLLVTLGGKNKSDFDKYN